MNICNWVNIFLCFCRLKNSNKYEMICPSKVYLQQYVTHHFRKVYMGTVQVELLTKDTMY